MSDDIKQRLEAHQKVFLNPFKGRIHRSDYFVFLIMIYAVDKIFSNVDVDTSGGLVLGGLAAIITLYLGLCGSAKRLRDIGFSGWFAIPVVVLSQFTMLAILEVAAGKITILSAIGFVGLILSLCLMFVPPQKRDNKYGVYDPLTLWNTSKLKKLEK